jgi:hypothetical protein
MTVRQRITQQVLAWRVRHPVPRPWRRWPRGLATNVALVLLGLAGAVFGGYQMGRWWGGLIIVAESGLAVYVGFNREDAQSRPVRGSRTVPEILADEAEVERGADEAEEFRGGPAAL